MDQQGSSRSHPREFGPSPLSPTPNYASKLIKEILHWGNESIKLSFQVDEGPEVMEGIQEMLDYNDEVSASSSSPWINDSLTALANQTILDGGPFSSEVTYPGYIKWTVSVLCIIILTIGAAGNLLVPIVVWTNKELRSSTNIFLVNLSLADILVLLVCTPPVLLELHTKPEVWLLGPFLCKLVPFAELSVAHASVLTILAISLERYIAICRPLRANYTCTKNRAAGLCCAIWIVGFIATSPVIALTQHKTLRYVDKSINNACITPIHNFWSQFYFMSSIVIFFFVPLLTLIGLYWVISRNLMSDPAAAGAAGRCCPDHPTMRARRQVVIMLATVVFFFFICLLPFRVFTMYIILAPDALLNKMDQEVYYNILYFCRIMLYLNSSINPILYNVMSSKFREGFFKTLRWNKDSRGGGRNQWMCRQFSRQSTFTTSSTLPSSSLKHHGHGKNCCLNGDSIRIRELTGNGNPPEPRNGHFHDGKHARALRATSGPYYPSNPPPKPVRQFSQDAAVIVHSTSLTAKEMKGMIRANSVV